MSYKQEVAMEVVIETAILIGIVIVTGIGLAQVIVTARVMKQN